MRLFPAACLCLFPVVMMAAAADTPSFEVASVKQVVVTGERSAMGRPDSITPGPAGVNMTNIRLKSVIQWAYHLQTIQVTGPGWLDSERYDIIAKAAGPVPADQLRLMMQTLLKERFKMEAHKETKEMPAYVFTVAKGGHKMKPSEGEGEMSAKPNAANGSMMIGFTHVSMAGLIDTLSLPLQGVIVDQTGLTGAWDFTLDGSALMMTQPTGIEEVISALIGVVNQQLGIRIDQKKVPAEVLIVDHAEKIPVEN